MNKKIKFGISLLFATACIAQAEIVRSNATSGAPQNDAKGTVIDFDSTIVTKATASPALTNGVSYSIDSLQLTVHMGTSSMNNDITVYLGVYTGLSGSTLSGFQGVSDSAITIIDDDRIKPITWDFSNMSVTSEANPGAGGDQRYFVFQTGTTALANLDAATTISLNRVKENEVDYANQLSAVLRPNGTRADTNPLYVATLSIPEPATWGLIAIMAGAVIFVHRRFVR